ncbi:hypothetical protein K438DRAFT_1935593 [Mycena galopus ATCC 62051]|nr:hypothetical protein K438DRAFT_1935593 [Mycena galopus ATCC 62051]
MFRISTLVFLACILVAVTAVPIGHDKVGGRAISGGGLDIARLDERQGLAEIVTSGGDSELAERNWWGRWANRATWKRRKIIEERGAWGYYFAAGEPLKMIRKRRVYLAKRLGAVDLGFIVLESGNSSREPAPSWTPVSERCSKRSELTVSEWLYLDGPPDGGETQFFIGLDPKNKDVLKCAENTALDNEGSGLRTRRHDRADPNQILDRLQPKQGARTTVDFKTLPGIPSIFPHWHVYLVKTTLNAISDEVRVFKFFTLGPEFVEELEFVTRLRPEVDFLLRPTYLVLDEAGRCTRRCSDESDRLAGITPSVSWSVKLGWPLSAYCCPGGYTYASCGEEDPGRRPLAHYVYENLVAGQEILTRECRG